MGQQKPPLTMMPEVLPRPTQVDAPGSVRARAVARIKTLAAAGATSVIASCGYAVVDPLPQPTCFESPKPTVTARYLPVAKDGGADPDSGTTSGSSGERLVEVKISFTQTNVTLGEIRLSSSEGTATLIEKQVSANEIRFVMSAGGRAKNVTAYVDASCAGANRPLQVNLELQTNDVLSSAY